MRMGTIGYRSLILFMDFTCFHLSMFLYGSFQFILFCCLPLEIWPWRSVLKRCSCNSRLACLWSYRCLPGEIMLIFVYFHEWIKDGSLSNKVENAVIHLDFNWWIRLVCAIFSGNFIFQRGYLKQLQLFLVLWFPYGEIFIELCF